MMYIKTPKYITYFQGGKWHRRLNDGAAIPIQRALKVKRADEPKGEAPERTTADLDWRDHQ